MNRGVERFTLIVATRDRPAEVRRLLTSLAAQRGSSLRLILIDQSSDDGFVANQRACATHLSRFEILHRRQRGSGLSAARNYGLQFLDGDFVAFPDDDCWYPPHLLETVAACFRRRRELDVISGRYDEPDRRNPNFPEAACRLTHASVWKCASSVTLFFRSQLFRRGLQFDERLGAGAELPVGEETDLMLRLLSSGARGAYEPSIVIYHAIERPVAGSISRARGMAGAIGFILARNALRPTWPLMLMLIRALAIAGCRSLTSQMARARFAGLLAGVRLGVLERCS